MTLSRKVMSLVLCLSLLIAVLSNSEAAFADHGEECSYGDCQVDPSTDVDQGSGTVVVSTPGGDGSPGESGSSDGGGVPAGEASSGESENLCVTQSALYGDTPLCQSQLEQDQQDSGQQPQCVDDDGDGAYDNEPCTGPTTQCVSFVVGDEDDFCDPGGPPARPVFTPPSVGDAAQEALAQVDWPVVEAGASDFGTGVVFGGFEYSLVLVGYEGWEPLVASATITQTQVVEGFVFTEDFVATLTATPREVVWDTGPINDTPKRHNPPRFVTCDGPGDAVWTGDGGRFQDYEQYNRYGGPTCAFVWWNNSAAIGGGAFEMSAEVIWDLTLVTSWSGDQGNVGEHSEVYTSPGLEAQLMYSVSVNEGSKTTQKINGGD